MNPSHYSLCSTRLAAAIVARAFAEDGTFEQLDGALREVSDARAIFLLATACLESKTLPERDAWAALVRAAPPHNDATN